MSPAPQAAPSSAGGVEESREARAARRARLAEPLGRAALIASVGGQRGWADWTNPGHRLRRLLAEFIGMAGLTFVLSGGAAVLARYGGAPPPPLAARAGVSLGSGPGVGGGGVLLRRHSAALQP